MFGIRQKLLLGFGVLIFIVVVISYITIGYINELGISIDTILKENYKSVVACQEMIEALERIDSGILFILLGDKSGKLFIDENIKNFDKAVEIELNNITLPGEKEKAENVKLLFEDYQKILPKVMNDREKIQIRRQLYFSKLYPIFQETKETARSILLMNQQNMDAQNNVARKKADIARGQLLATVMIMLICAFLFSYFTKEWILKPINNLLDSINEIRNGNLNIKIEKGSNDEIGLLSDGFDSLMKSFKINYGTKLTTDTQKEVEIVEIILDTAIIVNKDYNIEFSSESAIKYFDFKKGDLLNNPKNEWLYNLLKNSSKDKLSDEIIYKKISGKLHILKIMISPLRGNENILEGFAVILRDISDKMRYL